MSNEMYPPSGSLTPPRWRTCCHTVEGSDHLVSCTLTDPPQMPHCDTSILHAPGECRFCDMHPDFQAYREVARINFTGHADDGMAPCPSEFFRPGELRDRWPGNVAAPEGQPAPSYWEPLTDQAAYHDARGDFTRATDAMREAGYAAWYRGDPAGGWVESADLRPPEYPWYIRAYARLRWLAGKLR